MNNNDILRATQLEIAQRISNAAKEGNSEAFQNGLADLFANIHNEIVESYNSLQGTADAAALAQRGVRQLTSEETKFYNNLISAFRAAADKGTSPMMALTGAEKTFPETVVEAVMEDMKQNHPLLDAIDTVNTTAMTKWIINVDEGKTAAKWGAITETITQEIASGFAEVNLGQYKLTAFMPISNGILDLGPVWLDNYIRTCLSEALALGYETAVVTGTGKDQPIGMDRSVADNVEVTAGVYPQKDKVSVTDFSPASYGALIQDLAKTQKGKPRAVNDLILVVNPSDYFKIIMPATTIMNPNGGYVNNVLPYPTRIIQSVAVTQGEAILGMGNRYWLGVAAKRGIQFSDDYKFLEDSRYYKIVAYGDGRPKDNNSFLRLDISKLAPTYFTVKTVSDLGE